MGLPDTSRHFSLLPDTLGLQRKELGLREVGRRPQVPGAGGSLTADTGAQMLWPPLPGTWAVKATLSTLPAQEQMVQGCNSW